MGISGNGFEYTGEASWYWDGAADENLDSFAENVLALLAEIHPLDRVARAGYVLRGVAEPESVAAHSHFVTLLALLYTENYPADFDRGKTLAMAAIHDLPEAQLMDIPMPAGDAHLSGAKDEAENAIMRALFRRFRFGDCYTALHKELLEASTAEARLVRGLDKAQMMAKVWMYEREGRGRLEEFWTNPRNFDAFGIASVDALFDAICGAAGRERPRP